MLGPLFRDELGECPADFFAKDFGQGCLVNGPCAFVVRLRKVDNE